MPVGAFVAGSLRRERHDRAVIATAYVAPYGPAASKASVRRFPFSIPFAEPNHGQAARQARNFAALPRLAMPKHLIFGDADEIFTAEWSRRWARMLPGATFNAVPGAGHFVKEDAGEEVVSRFLDRAADWISNASWRRGAI